MTEQSQSQKKIIRALKDIQPAKSEEVAGYMFDGESECSCCNRVFEEFNEFHDDIASQLAELVIENRVAQNVNWQYAVIPEGGQND